MTPLRKQFLLGKIEEALKESASHVERAEGLFRAYQNASRSEEGDRAHAEASFELAKTIHQKLEDFKKEVLLQNDLPAEKIAPICFVTLNDKGFYYAQESLRIPGVTIIGTKSPLGQAILGKKTGDKYSYMTFSGEIIAVE